MDSGGLHMSEKRKVLFNSRLDRMKIEELIKEYADIEDALRRRGVIHSSNATGDLGEYFAKKFYGETKRLPKLTPAGRGTKNFDATSTKGETYSIKATTTKCTGPFSGMNPPGSPEKEQQVFHHVIIVAMSKMYVLTGIYELTWDSFLKHRKWVKGVHSYNLRLTEKLIADCIVRFPSEE
jgi:hypothetical protein